MAGERRKGSGSTVFNTHADLDARRHEGHKAGLIPAAGRTGLLLDVRSAVITSIISPAFLGLTAPTLVSSMKCLTQIVADAVSGTMFGATPPSVATPWNRNWGSECSRSISIPWNRRNTASRAVLPPPAAHATLSALPAKPGQIPLEFPRPVAGDLAAPSNSVSQ